MSPTQSSDAPLLLTERLSHNGADIVVITLNRPDQLNPLDKATVAALYEELTALCTDPPDAVVVTGAGDAFSAGGDLKGYQDLFQDVEGFQKFLRSFEEANALLERGPFLSVAMVNGACVAGGLELSLACDLVTVADEATIGDGHLRFSQLPGAGGSQRIVRAIGLQRARIWLYTAKLFNGKQAVEAGLAALSAPRAELRTRTLDFIAEICRSSPLARRTMKELINVALTNEIDEGLRIEQQVVTNYATTSHDAREGLLAFAERRPAKYLGR